jgi:hypothetical protein
VITLRSVSKSFGDQDVLKQVKDAESLLLSEMARLETHQNPACVKELSQRLGEIQKQIKALG